MSRVLDERQKLIDRLGRLGFNKKLPLYKTAYHTVADCYVSIKECAIYEDRYGVATPLLKCSVAGSDKTYWFRDDELTNYVL